MLVECISYHTKFSYMQLSLSRKQIMENMVADFEMVFSLKATCACFPDYSYTDHVEFCVLSKEMFMFALPSVDQWKIVEKYGRS